MGDRTDAEHYRRAKAALDGYLGHVPGCVARACREHVIATDQLSNSGLFPNEEYEEWSLEWAISELIEAVKGPTAIRECLEGIAEHACTSTGMVCSETDLSRHAWCHPCLANDALGAAAAAVAKKSAGGSSSARTEGADNQTCSGLSSTSGAQVAAEASKLGNTAPEVGTGRSGSATSIDRRRLRDFAKLSSGGLLDDVYQRSQAHEIDQWIDLGHEIAKSDEPLGHERLRAEVRRKVQRWRAIAVDWGMGAIEHAARLADLDRLRMRGQLDALEATVEQTIKGMTQRPPDAESDRWRVITGQDPGQPVGVTLERWCRLDNLEGSRRAGQPWGWRAQMVYRSAQEAQQALRGVASAKVMAAKQALEQARQAHELAEQLPDATSGEPIELAQVSKSVLPLTNGDNTA